MYIYIHQNIYVCSRSAREFEHTIFPASFISELIDFARDIKHKTLHTKPVVHRGDHLKANCKRPYL